MCPADIERYRPYEEDQNINIFEDKFDCDTRLAARLDDFINSMRFAEEDDNATNRSVITVASTSSEFSPAWFLFIFNFRGEHAVTDEDTQNIKSLSVHSSQEDETTKRVFWL